MSFHEIEENLRESFRVLAAARPSASIAEFPGVTIASAGVAFQMFNAAFLSTPVESPVDMEERLQSARAHFEAERLPWSFWICEDWLAPAVQKKLSRTCDRFGLRIASEMPGMLTGRIAEPLRPLPKLEFRRVDNERTLEDFRAIGSVCFHVPLAWFREVFDSHLERRRGFVCWVGYSGVTPVATAAAIAANGVAGIYNVATAAEYRRNGFGEAITRHAAAAAIAESGAATLVLQATSLGLHIYQRMGFRAVTRILVYNSAV